MTTSSILIAGHSHIAALGVQLMSPGYILREIADGEVPVVGLVGGWPREDTTYWDEIATHSADRTVAIFWRGNQHFHHFLIMPTNGFDFMLDCEPDLPIDTTLPIVPEATLIAFMRADMSDLDPIIATIHAAGGRAVLCGTPPPKADAGFVRERTVREGYFRNVAESRGFDIGEIELAPPLILYKVWKVMQNTLAEVAARNGARFMPVPAELKTADGFLRPDYYAPDATHANAAYGAIMLRELRAFVASGLEPAIDP